MLQGINTGGRYLTVTGGGSTYVNKSYSSDATMQGDMKYDLSSQCIKVFDGNSWQMLAGSVATVDLSYEAQSLLDWARKKREQEMELHNLAETNPTIKDLVNAMQASVSDYEHKIAMVKALIKKEETIGTN